jgi:DNA-3-methyladenine glycosylase II
MIPLVEHHGVPLIYNSISPKCRHSSSQKTTTAQKPSNCFQSLCRIVAGQQLAGPAAQATWTRLLKACNQILTPQSILGLAEEGFEDCLRQPAGLSNNKAKCIVALAQAFQDKELTEAWLCESSESDIRKALLKIKGLGPWSCDMFLMFFLEQGDIFPVGDLGVRKGVARFFNLKGKGKGGSLCPKKDFDKLQTALEPFKPYRSLVTYYMWKVADTKDFYKAEAKQETDSFTSTSPSKKKRKIH